MRGSIAVARKNRARLREKNRELEPLELHFVLSLRIPLRVPGPTTIVVDRLRVIVIEFYYFFQLLQRHCQLLVL